MKTKTPEEYLREPYSRVLIPEEEGGYSAEILEFPGCFSQGDTAQEALSNLEEAAENWIEATLAQGRPIPEPTASYEGSGKYPLRLPRSLYQKATQLAGRDGVSLNTFIVDAVAAKVGAMEFGAGMIGELRQIAADMEKRLIKQTATNTRDLAVQLVKAWDQPAANALSESITNAMDAASGHYHFTKVKETVEVRNYGRS